MKSKCHFCGTEFESNRIDGKWCAMRCKQYGLQIRYLENLRARAQNDPKAFHDKIRERWEKNR